MRNDKYVTRLYNEWVEHGKIIIGVDFDDTLKPWKLNEQEELNFVVKALKLAMETGCYLVVFTACRTDRYAEIEEHCRQLGLVIDKINQNPIELPYGNQNKIYANIFIDDRAGLYEAIEILESAAYRVRGKRYADETARLPEIA